MDKTEFRQSLSKGSFGSRIKKILHQGACSDTMEDDGRYMMDNNFTYSKELLEFALANHIPFVYASSAAVYGNSETFEEDVLTSYPSISTGFPKLLSTTTSVDGSHRATAPSSAFVISTCMVLASNTKDGWPP